MGLKLFGESQRIVRLDALRHTDQSLVLGTRSRLLPGFIASTAVNMNLCSKVLRLTGQKIRTSN